MIKLLDLLLEAVQGKPKAIFLVGAAGSGKSTMSKKLIPSSFISINVDDTYEELLKKSGLGLKQKDFDADQNKKAGELIAIARKATQDKFDQNISKKQNVLIDTVAGSSNTIQKKKDELEALGYECMMVMIYASPLTSLERNKQRERSLQPGIVLRTWHNVNKNINDFKKMFGDKFIIINNDSENNFSFSREKIEQYFQDTNPNAGKPKSPEEQAKSKTKKEEMYKGIETMIKNIPKFDSLDSAKTKINNFIK